MKQTNVQRRREGMKEKEKKIENREKIGIKIK